MFHRILGCLALLLTACAGPQVETTPFDTPIETPIRVLILGDSISMGYTQPVRELLGAEAVVVRPTNDKGKPENCAGTTKGIEHVDRWLALDGGNWDVIHFNFGLHDLKRVQPDTGKNSTDPDHPHQADLGTYRTQLTEIVEALEGTGARLVFATTTPVPEGVRPYRAPIDPVEYNAVALEVLDGRGVAVNDLFAFAEARLDTLQKPQDVHFTKEGSGALAGEVARAIRFRAGLDAE